MSKCLGLCPVRWLRNINLNISNIAIRNCSSKRLHRDVLSVWRLHFIAISILSVQNNFYWKCWYRGLEENKTDQVVDEKHYSIRADWLKKRTNGSGVHVSRAQCPWSILDAASAHPCKYCVQNIVALPKGKPAQLFHSVRNRQLYWGSGQSVQKRQDKSADFPFLFCGGWRIITVYHLSYRQ